MSTNLMEKLAISKAIMDKHNQISRGKSQDYSTEAMSIPEIQNFDVPSAKYNLPQEFITETKEIKNTNVVATKDRILNSKLPDEIKRLMIENPIASVDPMSPSNSVLSDELIEKASRLMGAKKEQLKENKNQSSVKPTNSNSDLKQMLKEVVKEVLIENGLISESSSKTDEIMTIRVGQHIFEGKISKVKKIK